MRTCAVLVSLAVGMFALAGIGQASPADTSVNSASGPFNPNMPEDVPLPARQT